MRTYKHHLYPRYLAKKGEIPSWGNPDAIVEVSFTQHIMFHWCNYQLWGNLEDKVAYSAMLGKKEEGQILSSKMANLAYIRKIRENSEFLEKVVRNLREGLSRKMLEDPDFSSRMKASALRGVEAALTPEARAKRLDSFRKNNHAQGHRNSQYGTMWITNGEVNQKIKKGELVPEGFRPGRVNGNKKLPLA